MLLKLFLSCLLSLITSHFLLNEELLLFFKKSTTYFHNNAISPSFGQNINYFSPQKSKPKFSRLFEQNVVAIQPLLLAQSLSV